eukprot:153949_1
MSNKQSKNPMPIPIAPPLPNTAIFSAVRTQVPIQSAARIPIPIAPPLPNTALFSAVRAQLVSIPSAAPIPSTINDKELTEEEINSNIINANKLLKDFDYKNKLLVFGFIRKNAFQQYDLFITSSIIGLMILYTFQERIKWTNISQRYASTEVKRVRISDDGRTVD